MALTDDQIEAADKAQLSKMPADSHCREPYWTATDDELQRFAKIIRNQALEDAAAQCGSVYHNHIGHEYGPVRYGAAACAYVIRAMKEQT